MSIVPNNAAPYAPPSAVLDFLAAVRDRDLPTPFTLEVLTRAGITEALAPRVLKALKLLDLVDEEGEPAEQLTALTSVGDDDYRTGLGAVVKSAYADVFQYVDPATAPLSKIQDQFRSYTPRGQRERMVTLFLGLCEFTGLSPAREREKTKRPASKSPKRRPAAPKSDGSAPKRVVPAESPPVEPPRTEAKERYLSFLLKRAEQGDDVDAELLDRIERVLGLDRPVSKPSSTDEGGVPDS